MKSLILFSEVVLRDLGTRCGVSTHRDCKTVARRSKHEGLSFLTITLADFGRNFERSLAEGRWLSLSLFKERGYLPVFLGDFLELVFERGTGRLLPVPDVSAIWAIRQFTLMWAKINLPCSDERERAAVRQYMECEQDVKETTRRINRHRDFYREPMVRLGRLLFSDILSQVDRNVDSGEVSPRHGPGATVDGLRGNAKWYQLEWPSRLEKVFRFAEHLYPNELAAYRSDDPVDILEPGRERPVRVVLVPKTQKTPRVIAIEPTVMQYMQQALSSAIVKSIERDNLLSSFIGFSDQIPNREMAREGSLGGELATLDLSEASDRVSSWHVATLFGDHRFLRKAIFAVRSTKAKVPGKGEVPLSKYASMGSALTFPLEAMVFLIIVLLGIERALNRPLTSFDLRGLVGSVRVYGDDIIVPVDYAPSVASTLEDYGFRVNEHKSFWTGMFRESCGGDYYSGADVTPVRVRSVFPSSRQHVQEIISTVSLRNQLYEVGLWASANFLDDLLGRLIPLPYVEESSPVLGRVSFLGIEPFERYDDQLQSPLVKGAVVKSVLPKSNLEGYPALNKWFLSFPHKPSEDENHLERAGRPRAVGIKVRWASPF